MNTTTMSRRRESGVALIVLLALLLLVSAAILLDRIGGEASASVASEQSSGNALAEAKAALIAWSATRPGNAAMQTGPGSLPFPDGNGDGNYDGFADCDLLGANDIVLVGRLPQYGEDAASCGVTDPLHIDPKDGSKEPLWYAVSRNLVTRPRSATNAIPSATILDDAAADFVAAGVQVGEVVANTTDGSRATVTAVNGPTQLALSGLVGGRSNLFTGGDRYVLGPAGAINPDMGGPGRMAYPWIQLRDAQGNVVPQPIAAIVFAPGPAIGAQDRSGAAAASNYLDSVTIGAATYDNADSDGCPDNGPCATPLEEFVMFPNPQSGDEFNDKLVYITVDELMRAVEKRALGDTALALDAYRNAGWNTGGVYPWLADFKNPRAGATGTADGGSTSTLTDATADFVADGVQVGDLILNTTNGDSALVTSVATTILGFTVDSLLGGADDDFDAGDGYDVQVPFKSTLARRGQLPVHRPNEIFHTTFTANWNLIDIDSYNSGDASLYPSDSETETNSISVTNPENGKCMWTEADRVDCYGIQIINPYEVNPGDWGYRVIEVSFSFTGRNGTVPDPATIVPPTATEPRRRNVSIFVDYDGAGDPKIEDPVPLADPYLPQHLWVVRITDHFGGNSGTTRLETDHDTEGTINVNGIRYDLAIVYDDVDDAKDELPEWLAENDWHHYVYAAFSPDRVVGGNADLDDDCTTPANACLSLNIGGAAARNDVPALLVSSGSEWANQNRDTGDCDGDGGGPLADPLDDSFLCAYLDSDTSSYDVSVEILQHGLNTIPAQSITADFFAREVFGTGFNDQLRIIE